MSGEGPRKSWFLDAPIYAQVDRDGDGAFELEYRYLQSAVSGDIVGFLPSSGPGSRLEYSMFGVPRYAAGARGNFGADIDDGTGSGTPDGGVDVGDLLYFLTLYEAGARGGDDHRGRSRHAVELERMSNSTPPKSASGDDRATSGPPRQIPTLASDSNSW